jgi:hypothetical protein
MCKKLHIEMGELSMQLRSCGGSRTSHLCHRNTPLRGKTRRNREPFNVAGRCRKYTCREGKPLSTRPIYIFGDLASFTEETAHSTDSSRRSLPSSGWNGRNFPSANRVLGNLAGLSYRLLFVTTRPDFLCGPEVQF